MVKIRLRRAGAKKRPFYRIVAIDSRRAPGGRALEFLGTYDPTTHPEKIAFDADRVEHWRSRGAQLTPIVRSLMRRARRQQAAESG
jgi:small subunit ribosomal protein S16